MPELIASRCFGSDLVDEVFAVEQLRDEVLLAGVEDLRGIAGRTRRRRLRPPSARRPRRAARYRPLSQATGPYQSRVERVVLVAFDEAVAVGVLGDQPLSGQLDLAANCASGTRVGRHLMFAQRAQDRSRLAVNGGKVVELAAKVDRAIRLYARGRNPPSRACRVRVPETAAPSRGRSARRGRRCPRSSRRLPSRKSGRWQTDSRSRWRESRC